MGRAWYELFDPVTPEEEHEQGQRDAASGATSILEAEMRGGEYLEGYVTTSEYHRGQKDGSKAGVIDSILTHLDPTNSDAYVKGYGNGRDNQPRKPESKSSGSSDYDESGSSSSTSTTTTTKRDKTPKQQPKQASQPTSDNTKPAQQPQTAAAREVPKQTDKDEGISFSLGLLDILLIGVLVYAVTKK